MKKLVSKMILTIAAMSFLSCSSGNLDYVKEHAPEKWKELGFDVIGYDGYAWGTWGFNKYGGAKVWHVLRKIPDNGIVYGGFLQRWGDELHMYNLTAYDAIKPQ